VEEVMTVEQLVKWVKKCESLRKVPQVTFGGARFVASIGQDSDGKVVEAFLTVHLAIEDVRGKLWWNYYDERIGKRINPIEETSLVDDNTDIAAMRITGSRVDQFTACQEHGDACIVMYDGKQCPICLQQRPVN
jgi:hypothetical protein